ncbi:hypothetical protein [Rhodococcus jostii]|uniref:N-acetyltransferase domain-containing protein n=1 Tax=Rhodococcus jostii TaxID=132919 RepID=A0A1H5MK45_RHOJO|nr:hypothetical protein [Rhodococcus jostii]SEE89686.1 hypothetical protein SAMN04490220_9067 [Rhodococcus jostii]
MTLPDISTTDPVVTGSPDLDAVVATLVAAFRDDPIIEWAIPPTTLGRDYHLAAFFASTTEFLLNHGGVVAAPEDYSAVLVWSPPGEPAVSDAENQAFVDRLAASTGACGARVRALMEALDAHHPADLPPHCHVMFAAVRPESRGTGVRASLTGALRAMRLHDGVGVYAEASSPRNLRLWERLGGRRVGAEIALPEGGPSLYPIFFGLPSDSVDAP